VFDVAKELGCLTSIPKLNPETKVWNIHLNASYFDLKAKIENLKILKNQ
jgi:hypothetical protein